MEQDDSPPSSYYRHEVTRLDLGGPPIIEYFDKEGNNVTPLPLHVLDEREEEQVRIPGFDFKKRFKKWYI